MRNHASRAVKKRSLILWGSTHPIATGYRQNVNLVNGVSWQPEIGCYGPTLHCQPCYKTYQRAIDSQVPCRSLVPYTHHVLPQEIHPDPVLHACMAAKMLSNEL